MSPDSSDGREVPTFPDGNVVVAFSSSQVLFYRSGEASPFLTSDTAFVLDGETCI